MYSLCSFKRIFSTWFRLASASAIFLLSASRLTLSCFLPLHPADLHLRRHFGSFRLRRDEEKAVVKEVANQKDHLHQTEQVRLLQIHRPQKKSLLQTTFFSLPNNRSVRSTTFTIVPAKIMIRWPEPLMSPESHLAWSSNYLLWA